MDDRPVGDGTTTLSDPPPRSLLSYGPLASRHSFGDQTIVPVQTGRRVSARSSGSDRSRDPRLANTGSLGSSAASPAFVLAQAFVADGVRVAPFVRKWSRLRARQGRDRGRSALGAEVWRLVHPSAESAQMQQRRREWCNSIGAEADGSHLDNAANRPGCEIGGRPRRVSAAGIRSRARASM